MSMTSDRYSIRINYMAVIMPLNFVGYDSLEYDKIKIKLNVNTKLIITCINCKIYQVY